MKIFSDHPHWEQVLEVCTTLSKAGFKAYLAGGCVRDALLNISPQDFDVATDATPDQVLNLFSHALEVGKSFGVIVVILRDVQIEVASFRKDLAYKDGRHPQGIEFSSPEIDAQRRDFTVNALYYDWVEEKIIDYVGGTLDMESKILRCVGAPDERFAEDHLRIIRAIRFHAQLGFEIEDQTRQSILKNFALVKDVSKERVREEFLKLLKSSRRSSGMEFLCDSGVMATIHPQLGRLCEPTIKEKMQLTLSQPFQLTGEVNLWGAWLLNVAPKGLVPTILKTLKCSNYVVSYVDKLTSAYWTTLDSHAKPSVNMKFLSQLGHDLLELHRIQEAVDPALSRRAELSHIPLELPKPWVSSADLKEMGVAEGPLFGRILDEVFDLQLNGELGRREEALTLAKKMASY